jgi:hypothetical protein
MSVVQWHAVVAIADAVLLTVIALFLFGETGVVVALLAAVFVGAPVTMAINGHRARIETLETRVAELESAVEKGAAQTE